MSGLAHRVMVSSTLMLLIRFVQRGLGIVSTLILARLLTPADFGIVAIIAIVIQFFDLVSTAGSEPYLIQKRTLDERDLATAWTVNLAFKAILWLVLMLCAPWVAEYYDRPDLALPVRVASLVLLINGLVSPGLALLKRELKYRKILHLSIWQKVISFTVVMLVVLHTPSYWALIFGDIVSALVMTIGSFLVYPYRPSATLARVGEQVRFSQWIFLRNVLGFVRAQIDTLLVTKNFAMADVGIFHVSKSLSAMPAKDIVAPAVEPLLSAFARVRDDRADLAFKVRVSVCFVVFLIMPVCTYIAFFPDSIIDVFLGDQWTGAYAVLANMTPLLLTLSISRVFESICIAIERLRDLFVYNVLSTLFLTLCLLTLVDRSLESFVLLRSLLGLFVTLAFLAYLSTLLDIRLRRLSLLCAPIVLSALAAGFSTAALSAGQPTGFVKLVVTSALYFPAYGALMVLCYALLMRRTVEYRRVVGLLLKALPRGRRLAH